MGSKANLITQHDSFVELTVLWENCPLNITMKKDKNIFIIIMVNHQRILVEPL